jgi:hypothetical protein
MTDELNNPGDLLTGDDDQVVRENVRELRRKGYPESEATAIALRKSREQAKPRRSPPPTVKGQDIELLESDGQRVPEIAAGFLPSKSEGKQKEGVLERIVNKTPFGKAAKALKGEQ